MNEKFQFPSDCYQKLKQSPDIFNRVSVAFVILKLKDSGENIPEEEIKFAYDTLREHHTSVINKEEL